MGNLPYPSWYPRTRFPNFLISPLNYTFDSSVILSRINPSISFGGANKTHVELFQDTLITTASPALALQALLPRICQMAYYEQLVVVEETGHCRDSILARRDDSVVVIVLFVRSTDISFIGSYWQRVAQIISKETQPILKEEDHMDDGTVRKWAKSEQVVESLGDCWALRESGGRVNLGPVEKGE
ncbi:hypothetical protein N7447_007197 [Penicillium robsamsonii]|uniref:uncharacterized protein n=1 Tax=Penicillium robsamsonii TaxID=1792511 RepID=UPI002548A8A6|nr:uncharacterized protein N7447_007197 [Penicillium robsamsonii]KAJ5824857.1 hypothetical protein N7447_007197 [Penicillium robsamsonii]